MLNLNFEQKKVRIMIFGLQGSGKSVLLRSLLKKTKKHLIYDYHHEHKGLHRYLPTMKDSMEQKQYEVNEFLRCFVQKFGQKSKKTLDVVGFDEMNQYCPPKPKELPIMIQDLNDNHRHYYNEKGISFIGVARRPTQVHSDLIELAHYRIFFKLTGKNDLLYLDSLKEGLGDAVRELEPFHFAMLDAHGDINIEKPVTL